MKLVNLQKIAKLNFVYDIRVMRNIFVSYYGCSRMNQEKYAFANTSELIRYYLVHHKYD
jgi:hypothetical protein